MALDKHIETAKVKNGTARADTGNERLTMVPRSPKRNVRQRSLRSTTMKFSSIHEEVDQSSPQRMEASFIGELSIPEKFNIKENDQPILLPIRQERSQCSLVDGPGLLSVASAKFRLPEETNPPMYCPFRQLSRNVHCSLQEISSFGESYDGSSVSYLSIGIDESNPSSTTSELCGLSY